MGVGTYVGLNFFDILDCPNVISTFWQIRSIQTYFHPNCKEIICYSVYA